MRKERKLPPFSFIGFGGGLHACMGEQFGYLQVTTILSLLFRLYDLELVGAEKGLPAPDYTAMVVGPKAGSVRVRYRKRA